MARLLELYADEAGSTPRSPERRDGWLGARQLARILPRRGSLPGPDLVVLMLDPVADLVSISPGHLAALGRRVPAKPYFSLVEGRPVPFPPFALAPRRSRRRARAS